MAIRARPRGRHAGRRRRCARWSGASTRAPSSVIVLEVLSQILPDHTYVTELRIEGDKLRVIGVTRDAPLADPPDGAVAATSPAPPSSRRPRERRPIRASASTSRRRSNPSSRCAHDAATLTGASLRPPLAGVLATCAVVDRAARAGLVRRRRHSRAPPGDRRVRRSAGAARGPQALAARAGAPAETQVPTGSPFLEGPDADRRGRRAAAARRRCGHQGRRQRAVLAGRRAGRAGEGRLRQRAGKLRGRLRGAAAAALRSRSRHAVPVRRAVGRADAADRFRPRPAACGCCCGRRADGRATNEAPRPCAGSCRRAARSARRGARRQPARRARSAAEQRRAGAGRHGAHRARRAPERPADPTGNPLWAIPLSSLTATRERPLFLPSRRAPAPAVAGTPVVVAPPPPPPPAAEPEQPPLMLVGAIASDTEGYRGLPRSGDQQRHPAQDRAGP